MVTSIRQRQRQLTEDNLLNGGFLFMALTIIFINGDTKTNSLYVLAFLCSSIAIPILALNVFAIEYRKHFVKDIEHKFYENVVSAGISMALLGLIFFISSKAG